MTRVRVIQHLRTTRLSLNAIRARIGPLNDEQLRALLPPAPRATSRDGVPPAPPPPSYPAVMWESVTLMDGLILFVQSGKGAALRRIADEIYRYYGGA